MIEQAESRVEFDPLDVAYTGPGTLAGRYLRSFWQPIHPSSGVERGRARAIRVLGEEFTLYRGASGEPHLVDHRCAHRGTQLSVGAVEGEAIRCYYHGWKYDENGQCIEQPAEPQPFCEKIRIRSFPVRDYIGLVFAYLGEGEPPPFTRYERLEERSDRLRIRTEIAPFNYFQRLENAHDFTHLPFVHKQCFPIDEHRSLDNVVPRVRTEETSWGMKTYRTDPNGLEVVAYYGMPNVNYIVIGGGSGREWEGEGESLLIRVPVDDENHLQFSISWGDSPESGTSQPRNKELHNAQRAETVKAIFEGKMTIDDFIATARPEGMFGVQDDVAMIGQGTIWHRQPEHLGRADVGVIQLRKLWASDLRALRDGKRPRAWHRTPDMFPTVVSPPRDVQ